MVYILFAVIQLIISLEMVLYVCRFKDRIECKNESKLNEFVMW